MIIMLTDEVGQDTGCQKYNFSLWSKQNFLQFWGCLYCMGINFKEIKHNEKKKHRKKYSTLNEMFQASLKYQIRCISLNGQALIYFFIYITICPGTMCFYAT